MRAHGGDIALAASTGAGTTFCLTLPGDSGETQERREERAGGVKIAAP